MAATLSRSLRSVRASGHLADGLVTADPDDTQEQIWSCKALVSNFSAQQIAEGLAVMGERQITILGGTLSDSVDPAANDQITVDGGTYTLVAQISKDAAGAAFVFRARP